MDAKDAHFLNCLPRFVSEANVLFKGVARAGQAVLDASLTFRQTSITLQFSA